LAGPPAGSRSRLAPVSPGPSLLCARSPRGPGSVRRPIPLPPSPWLRCASPGLLPSLRLLRSPGSPWLPLWPLPCWPPLLPLRLRLPFRLPGLLPGRLFPPPVRLPLLLSGPPVFRRGLSPWLRLWLPVWLPLLPWLPVRPPPLPGLPVRCSLLPLVPPVCGPLLWSSWSSPPLAFFLSIIHLCWCIVKPSGLISCGFRGFCPLGFCPES